MPSVTQPPEATPRGGTTEVNSGSVHLPWLMALDPHFQSLSQGREGQTDLHDEGCDSDGPDVSLGEGSLLCQQFWS